MLLLSSAVLFKKSLSGTKTIRVSKGLDPDQDQHSVCPDPGPKLFAKVNSRRLKVLQARKELIFKQTFIFFT